MTLNSGYCTTMAASTTSWACWFFAASTALTSPVTYADAMAAPTPASAVIVVMVTDRRCDSLPSAVSVDIRCARRPAVKSRSLGPQESRPESDSTGLGFGVDGSGCVASPLDRPEDLRRTPPSGAVRRSDRPNCSAGRTRRINLYAAGTFRFVTMAGTDGEDIEDLPPSAKLVFKVLEYDGPLTQKQIVEESIDRKSVV